MHMNLNTSQQNKNLNPDGNDKNMEFDFEHNETTQADKLCSVIHIQVKNKQVYVTGY